MVQEVSAAAAEHIAQTVVEEIRAKLGSSSDGGWEKVDRSNNEMDGSDGDGSASPSEASSGSRSPAPSHKGLERSRGSESFWTQRRHSPQSCRLEFRPSASGGRPSLTTGGSTAA